MSVAARVADEMEVKIGHTLFVLRIVLQKKPKLRFVDFYTFS